MRINDTCKAAHQPVPVSIRTIAKLLASIRMSESFLLSLLRPVLGHHCEAKHISTRSIGHTPMIPQDAFEFKALNLIIVNCGHVSSKGTAANLNHLEFVEEKIQNCTSTLDDYLLLPPTPSPISTLI